MGKISFSKFVLSESWARLDHGREESKWNDVTYCSSFYLLYALNFFENFFSPLLLLLLLFLSQDETSAREGGKLTSNAGQDG